MLSFRKFNVEIIRNLFLNIENKINFIQADNSANTEEENREKQVRKSFPIKIIEKFSKSSENDSFQCNI